MSIEEDFEIEPTKTPFDPQLMQLLTTASKNLKDQTAKLVAADYMQENGLHPNCEAFLRRFAELDPSKFHLSVLFTGSRLYGNPKPESDIDWVVFFNPADMPIIETYADVIADEYGEEYPDASSYRTTVNCLPHIAYRIGPINLICCSHERQWQTWKKGTEELVRTLEIKRLIFPNEPYLKRDTAIRTIELRFREEQTKMYFGANLRRLFNAVKFFTFPEYSA